MRRTLALMLASGLLVLGATACGVTSDAVKTGAPPVTTPTTAGGSETTAAPDSTEPGSTDTTAPTDATTETTEGSATTTGGGGGSSNPKVAAYCKAVNAYVAEVNAAKSDPSKLGSLAADGQKLAELAQGLASAGLTAADAQVLSDCTKKATDALTGG